jgi:hypothetical protein
LSFKAMLRTEPVQAQLKQLSCPTMFKVMQAALTGAGCTYCAGASMRECMCPPAHTTQSRHLSPCSCKTRSQCSWCNGWLDA